MSNVTTKVKPLFSMPRLALTLGEPAGIGPDICLKMAQHHPLSAEIVVVGSPDLLLERAKILDIPIHLSEFDPHLLKQSGYGHLSISAVDLNAPCIPGELNADNNVYVRETLTTAYQLCADNLCQALVTGPVHKAILNQAGYSFSGHTEFLAQLANVKAVLMTFYTPECIVALATTHYPLNQVSALITHERLTLAIERLHEGISRLFKIAHPKISVCGLNPHAGEEGVLGSEDKEIISPCIQIMQQRGYDLEGPIPGDTAFSPDNRRRNDAILAMYHDQGLAPIKALFFSEIVNMTLGLPFLRTSVDHGTALNLAGTGKAIETSLYHAVKLAAKLSGS